jgi:stress-induced morphogen
MLRGIRRAVTEAQMKSRILEALGQDTQVTVTDTSGGCGAMFRIRVKSPSFRGKSTIQQHRLVNSCIKFQEVHGISLETEET